MIYHLTGWVLRDEDITDMHGLRIVEWKRLPNTWKHSVENRIECENTEESAHSLDGIIFSLIFFPFTCGFRIWEKDMPSGYVIIL